MPKIYILSACVATTIVNVLHTSLTVGLCVGKLRCLYLRCCKTTPHQSGGCYGKYFSGRNFCVGCPNLCRSGHEGTNLSSGINALLYLLQPLLFFNSLLLNGEFFFVLPASQIYIVGISVSPRFHFIVKVCLGCFTLPLCCFHRNLRHLNPLVHKLIHILHRSIQTIY